MPNLTPNEKIILSVKRANIYRHEQGCVSSSGGLVFDIGNTAVQAV